MIDINICNFRPLNIIEEGMPEELFMDSYIEEIFESENACDTTKRVHAI